MTTLKFKVSGAGVLQTTSSDLMEMKRTQEIFTSLDSTENLESLDDLVDEVNNLVNKVKPKDRRKAAK